MSNDKPVYKRILLKLSGEALMGEDSFGVDFSVVRHITQSAAELHALGVQVAIVMGGGNFFRGVTLQETGLNRVTCDHMGMLATVMNGLVLREDFAAQNKPVTLMSSLSIPGIVDRFDRFHAIQALEENNHILVFVGGTGSPLFSTDSASSLRAIEIQADVILKATKVDGVFSKDPKIHDDAQFFKTLTYQDAIERNLKVMDATAICLCRDNHMPIRVFNMNESGILKRIVMGSDEGSLIE